MDSLSEGVGSSQITPLILKLAEHGMKIKLISCEKFMPLGELSERFSKFGVVWKARNFGLGGNLGGLLRLNDLRREISGTAIIHGRSDIPTVSGIFSKEAPVLWDVRSLWADQKVMIQDNAINRLLYKSYHKFEQISANRSTAMSTLTHAVVPILERRNRILPNLRTVVPTTTDLQKFRLHTRMPSKVLALFSGTYNNYYDLELSADFMKHLRKIIDVETHWAKPRETTVAKIGVGEERTFEITQEMMAEFIPNYSFGISVCKLDTGDSLAAAMPTKIAEFLACGRPVVINKGLGDLDAFIKEFNVGVILDGTSDNLISAASQLVSLIRDPETPSRCRALAEKYFNMNTAATKYISIYSKMLE